LRRICTLAFFTHAFPTTLIVELVSVPFFTGEEKVIALLVCVTACESTTIVACHAIFVLFSSVTSIVYVQGILRISHLENVFSH
jgi:hypothetical protein